MGAAASTALHSCLGGTGSAPCHSSQRKRGRFHAEAGEADAVGDGAELLPSGYDDDHDHEEGTTGHGGGDPRGPPTRAWGHHKRPRPLPPPVPAFALPTPRVTLRSADELAVAWAVPADPLLRDRHDTSAYKLEIRAADCHWSCPLDSSNIIPRLDPHAAAPQPHKLALLATPTTTNNNTTSNPPPTAPPPPPPHGPGHGQQAQQQGGKEEVVTRRLRRHGDYLLPGSRVEVRVRAICGPNAGMVSPAIAARFLHAPLTLHILRPTDDGGNGGSSSSSSSNNGMRIEAFTLPSDETVQELKTRLGVPRTSRLLLTWGPKDTTPTTALPPPPVPAQPSSSCRPGTARDDAEQEGEGEGNTDIPTSEVEEGKGKGQGQEGLLSRLGRVAIEGVPLDADEAAEKRPLADVPELQPWWRRGGRVFLHAGPPQRRNENSLSRTSPLAIYLLGQSALAKHALRPLHAPLPSSSSAATDASLLALPFPCTLEYDSHTIIGDLKTALLRHWPHHPAAAPLPLAPKDLLFLRFRPPPSTPSLVPYAVPEDERVADVALPSPALVHTGPIPPKSASACAHLLLAFNPPPQFAITVLDQCGREARVVVTEATTLAGLGELLQLGEAGVTGFLKHSLPRLDYQTTTLGHLGFNGLRWLLHGRVPGSQVLCVDTSAREGDGEDDMTVVQVTVEAFPAPSPIPPARLRVRKGLRVEVLQRLIETSFLALLPQHRLHMQLGLLVTPSATDTVDGLLRPRPDSTHTDHATAPPLIYELRVLARPPDWTGRD